MFDDRWQLISRDTDDLFGILRGNETWLSTVGFPNWREDGNLTVYESCLFTAGSSEVLARYSNKSDAINGHHRLAKKFNLR